MSGTRDLRRVLPGQLPRAQLHLRRHGHAAASIHDGIRRRPRRLDAVLLTEVRDRFDHRNINLDVPEFGDGRLMPTGENLARFICERVQAALGADPRVTRVVVAEDATLSATYEPD